MTVAKVNGETLIVPSDGDDLLLLLLSLEAFAKSRGRRERQRIRAMGDPIIREFADKYSGLPPKGDPNFVLYGEAADVALSAVAFMTKQNHCNEHGLEDYYTDMVMRGRTLLQLAGFEAMADSARSKQGDQAP